MTYTPPADLITGDTGQNAQLTAGNRKELSFSTTTANAPLSTEIGNYRWVSVHIVSQGTGSTVNFQGSNDNTNWVSTSLIQISSNAGPSTQSSSLSGAIYHGHCPFRYFRLNVTGITAGTTAGVVEFFSLPMTYQTAQIDVLELPNAATLADATANPTTTVIASDAHVFNGTSWDRARSVSAADGTSGTGLLATGLLYWDGSKYARVRPDNGLPVSCAYYETTASASALNGNVIPTVDVRGYTTVAAQLTFTGTATVTFQASNDGTTWFSQYIERCDTPNAVAATATASGIYACPVRFRYLRAQITAYTSGTVTAVWELLSLPATPTTVATNAASVTSVAQLPAAAALADGAANPTTPTVGAGNLVWNGSGWERVRTPGAVLAAGSGTGLPAAGLLGHDGTNYQRIRTDTVGQVAVNVENFPLPQTGAYSVLNNGPSAVNASVASTAIVSTNFNRTGLLIYNDSTATLYLSFGSTAASPTSYSIAINAQGYYEVPFGYFGDIQGTWSAANGAARVTEFE